MFGRKARETLAEIRDILAKEAAGDDYPEADNDSYARWLRAQRPHSVWFYGQSTLVQEALASIGDDHTSDLCDHMAQVFVETVDTALQNYMAATGAQVDTGQQRKEAILDRARQMLGEPITLGGITERREARQAEHEERTTRTKSLFGKPPDEVSA